MLGHRTLAPTDYLNILKKRWWILAIPALILPVVLYAASYLVPPQYLSQTLVLVQQQRIPNDIVKPISEDDISARLATMKEQILSRSRLQPILDRFSLYANDHMTMDDRIAKMQKDIGVKPIRSDMAHGLPGFYITFTASDARTAQAVCEEITSMFVTENLRNQAAQTEGTTEFLQNQLNEAKRALDDQDSKLAKFQETYVGKLPGQQDQNVNMLASLNTQLAANTQTLDRMQQDKTLLETLLAQQSHDVATTTSAGKVAPAAQDAELQSLLAQEASLSATYTDDYPDVIAVRRKIRDLRHQMAQAPAPSAAPSPASVQRADSPDIQRLRLQIRGLDMSIAQQRREQSNLQSQVGLYQGRISSSPLVEEQYKNLTRDYNTTLARYNDLLSKTNDTKMARDLQSRQQGEQFSIVDSANLPESPSSPKRPVFAAGGLALGLALGLGIIALLEYRNTALRTERDVWSFTKLPTLATISLLNELPKPSRLGNVLRGKGFRPDNKTQPQSDTPLTAAGR